MTGQTADPMGRFSSMELDKRVSRSVDLFMQGYGCCQSVVAAFADLYGLDETMALRIAAGFGNLGATLVGVAVILVLVAFLISMIQFISTDFSQNFSLWVTRF